MSSEEPEVQRTPGGHEIPVPSRDEVFRDLGKVARGGKHRVVGSRGRPKPPPRHGGASDGREGGAQQQ